MKKSVAVAVATGILACTLCTPAAVLAGNGNGCGKGQGARIQLRLQDGTGQGQGCGFVDADGDGTCDNAGQGRCRDFAAKIAEAVGRCPSNQLGGERCVGGGHGAFFVDADGDGTCDNLR